MRSNIVRTASGASLPVSTLTSVLPPAAHQLVLEPQLVEAAPDDEVHKVVNRARAVVEARRKKEHDRARLPNAQHVLEVDRRERRLARAEHELAALLESDACRPLDQVRHRPGGDRAERAHRAGADHVRVHLGRATRVGRVPVALVVERDGVAYRLGQASQRLVRRESCIAVQLGRQHLDPRPRGAEPDLAAGAGERLEQSGGVRRARGPRYPQENAHGSQCYFGPFEASRNAASLRRLSSPRAAKGGIGEPGLTQLGHLRWSIWNWMPLFLAPSALRSGAPRFVLPVPRYVWQATQPDSAKRFAPAIASSLPAKPCCAAHDGIAALTSLAIASCAVAPL